MPDETQQEQPSFDNWCVLEIFGHQTIVGRVTEQIIAGQGFIRIEVPEGNGKPAFTKFYGPKAIYSLTPTDERTARSLAGRLAVEPVSVFALPSPREMDEDDGDAGY